MATSRNRPGSALLPGRFTWLSQGRRGTEYELDLEDGLRLSLVSQVGLEDLPASKLVSDRESQSKQYF